MKTAWLAASAAAVLLAGAPVFAADAANLAQAPAQDLAKLARGFNRNAVLASASREPPWLITTRYSSKTRSGPRSRTAPAFDI